MTSISELELRELSEVESDTELDPLPEPELESLKGLDGPLGESLEELSLQ